MKYLPILSELFESNSYIFLIIGILLAWLLRYRTKNIFYLLPIYVACEVLTYFSINYLLTYIAFFLGTIILGMIVGTLLFSIFKKIKSRK